MRVGMSSIRGAGAPSDLTPNHPVATTGGNVGYLQSGQCPAGYSYQPTANPEFPCVPDAPRRPVIRTGPECPPGSSYQAIPGSNEFGCVPNGTTGTGDSTPGTTGTGDQTQGRTGTGDQTRGSTSTGDRTSILPSLRNVPTQPVPMLGRVVIPCTSPWTPRAYGGTNLAPPVIGAGAASFSTTPFTAVDVLGWATFGLGLLLGAKLIDNVYASRRVAA